MLKANGTNKGENISLKTEEQKVSVAKDPKTNQYLTKKIEYFSRSKEINLNEK